MGEKKWLSTTPLLSNKSTSEVFLAPFWYVNIESEVGEPTSLTMLELVIKLRMPSATHEAIECFSKVLDTNPVTCGSGISRGPNVVFKVFFSTTLMSPMLKLHILKTKQPCTHKLLHHFRHLKLALHKLINGKLCVLLMYMYFWDMRIWCPNSLWCVLLCWEDKKIVAWLLELL